jgi:CubicO group peptidase (beta-lactamase class C family)
MLRKQRGVGPALRLCLPRNVMLRNRGLIAAAFLLSLSARAQTPSAGPSPRANVSTRVDNLFEKWDRTDSPGCALSVMKDGHIIYEHGYGMADLDHNVIITPSTVFHVASMSKQFTAASIVLLAQQGKLSFDDDIRKYIPELHDFGTSITIRELIHHTSGLRDQWDLLELGGWRYSLDLITNDDVLSLVTREKELNFKPGDREIYSNTGYTLLGLIVSRISGMTLREFTTENIFLPLGMKNTHFRDDHSEIVKNNADGYQKVKDGQYRLSNTNFDTVGATSLHTTVEDLAIWDENFYHPRVGGANFPSQMLERGKLNSGEQTDYAFGLALQKYKGLPMVHHGGADAGYRSELTRFPEQHFSTAVLCNASDTFPVLLAQQVAEIYLAEEMKAAAKGAMDAAESKEVQLTAEQLSGLAGVYWNRQDDSFIRTYVKDGKLHFTYGADGSDSLLASVTATYFHQADVPYGDQVNFRFEPSAPGKPGRLLNSYGEGKPDVFESVDTFAPNGSELAEYVGEYTSEEIDPVYRLMVQEGKLTLAWLKHKPIVLDPRTRDAFASSAGTIRFTRDPTGHISGFLLSDGRILNFRFTRQRK